MKIGSMFEKDINRPINGVIKVMQTDDENKKQELEEYVITRELQKHFAAFYDHYQEGIDGNTDKMGVWISGFFGSGKSHFLKILSYLLQNDTVEGKKAIDYFAEKFDYDPYLYSLMKRISETPTESILFNIDAKSPMGKDQDAILRVFTKVFYERCGYYGDDMKVASFERFLDKQGKLKEFQEAFKRINGETWESTREAFAFWEEDIVSALTEVTGISEQAARNWFNGEETAEISIDKLAREIKEYVDSKEPNFHLVFLVDEIGQYIGDNSSLMLNLQTVVEELGSKCNGKVWVIVTSQEDIDSITHVKGNDFSKIQGRFNTRLSLSSSSVDEVIKRRLLAKTPEAESLLKLMYQQNAASMRSIFTFTQDTVSDLKGYSSEDDYVTAYPFVPYQFKLMQDALVQIRKHGSSGKHLSSGARSMLSSYQEVAQKIQEYDEKSFVPFYRFFDTVYSFLDGAIRRVIDRADRAAEDGNGLKKQDVDVLKLLFLIRYVDGIPTNIENLATLMIADINADKILIKRSLQESLDRLEHEGYITRNGEIYQFLTDEEQDINREIRQIPVDYNDVNHLIGQIIFADIYPGKRYRYKNRYDFAFDQMVDNALVGQPMSDIKVRLATVNYNITESDADSVLIMQSKAGKEAIVLLSTDYDYYHELEMVLKVQKYVKQRNLSQLPESIRKIIQARQSEAKEREKAGGNLLKEAIVNGTFYISGSRVNVRASNVKDALDQSLNVLIEDVYNKLNYVGTFAQSEADILKILNGTSSQESMIGVDHPNQRALEDMEQFMDIRQRQHMQVTVADMHKKYRIAPYGWQELDIAALIATLIKQQKIQLVYGGAVVVTTDRKIVDYLRKRTEIDKAVIRRRIDPPEILKNKARTLASELFGIMDLKPDADGLCGQIQELLGGLRSRNNAVSSKYVSNISYPGKAITDKGQKLFEEILSKKDDHITFLEAFTNHEDDLLDWNEDFHEVEFFFTNQAQIFADAWKLCEKVKRESTYFTDEQDALNATEKMNQILKEQKPYRRIVELPTLMQTVNQAYKRINEARLERVQQTIVQARGDLHTLAADHSELKERIRKEDEELERRKEAALQATSPTQLDAMITQIYTYKDAECRWIEDWIAKQNAPLTPPTVKPKKIKTLRRYDIVPQKRLTSEQEINDYVDDLRRLLMNELKDNDVIQLN